MSQLKTLVVTNNGYFPAKLNNFQLCSLLNLKRINLERISVTSIFTANLQLPNLRKISLITCEIGEAFENSAAKIPYMWPKLVEMNIEHCDDLEGVPAEICDLVDLKRLSICSCHELVALPEELGRLTNLEMEMDQLCSLRTLCMGSRQSFSKLPDSLQKLVNLKDVVCDEETAFLWESVKQYQRNMRITVMKGDINLHMLHKSFI